MPILLFTLLLAFKYEPFALQGKTALQADIDAIAESIDFLKFNHYYAKVCSYEPLQVSYLYYVLIFVDIIKTYIETLVRIEVATEFSFLY